MNFYFKDRDGQTPLPLELQKDLIPKNVQTIGELDEYEEQNIAEGLIWLNSRDNKDCLDFVFWLKLHQRLFNQVWKWAGKIRRHELNNPDFSHPNMIRNELFELIKNAEFWFDNETFTANETIARIHERLLTIHPFANGNGRWSRIITEFICKAKHIPKPSWNIKRKDSPEIRRTEYIEAIEKARKRKEFKTLADLIFN